MKIVFDTKNLIEWILEKCKEDPEYWKHHQESYDNITEHKIECFVPTVDKSSYLQIVSEALDVMFMIHEHNSLGDYDLTYELCQTGHRHSNFDVVFYFETRK